MDVYQTSGKIDFQRSRSIKAIKISTTTELKRTRGKFLEPL